MSPPDREQRVLDYGDDAVERALDAILDDDAAADPLQKGRKKKKTKQKCDQPARGKTLVIVAGGWSYQTKDDEIFEIKKDSWKPTTEDFRAMATADGSTPLLANNPSQFFRHIADQPTGSIGRVVFIGHGAFGIVFSGDAGGVGGGAQLDNDNLADFQSDIDKKVKPKLHPNAKIDLVVCYTGGNESFMDSLANALARCVRGFTSAIEIRNPAVSEDSEIIDRGFARIEGSGKSYKKGWKHLKFEISVSPGIEDD